jgi:hypothetical protein
MDSQRAIRIVQKSKTAKDLTKNIAFIKSDRALFKEQLKDFDRIWRSPKSKVTEKLKLKPNDINLFLRTGYDPELAKILNEYDPLEFGTGKLAPNA